MMGLGLNTYICLNIYVVAKINRKLIYLIFLGKVTKVKPNLTEEEYELMTMNKTKRAKKLGTN